MAIQEVSKVYASHLISAQQEEIDVRDTVLLVCNDL